MKLNFLCILCFVLCFEMRAQTRKPNIIFVLADDLGWAELGCYGNSFNETPNLDRLAKEGVRFTHAYAAAPVCSPYRAALLTGQHPARIGITDYLRPNSSNGLSVSHVSLPEIFAKHEYATGMVGKWHLTGYAHHEAEFELRPKDHGFDWNIGSEVKGVGNGANFFPYVFRTQPISWIDLPENKLGKNEYLTDRLNYEAVEFIERNQDKPFFLYLSHYAPHTILNGRPDLVEKYIRKHKPGPSTRENCYLCEDSGQKGKPCYHWSSHHNPHLAAMLESIDDGIGMIDRKLRELGLDHDTIFIFSSDNGGETNVTTNAPLRGGKSQLYEGGVRVPLIVRWPNGSVPAGRVSSQAVVNYDFYPTFIEAAKISPDPSQTLDGVSILKNLRDPDKPPHQRALYWHYPLDRPHFLGGVSSGSVQEDAWKLIEFFDPARKIKHELYNLNKDPSEKTNLAAIEPERLKDLQAKLAEWRRKVGARIPSRPLLVEPRNLLFGDHFSEGQVSSGWFFQKEWEVSDGFLLRNEIPGENKRLFYKEPDFKDGMVRFDFQFDGASDIRLVTGSSGHYNTVLHIRPDHFYLQTASDPRGPWFSMRQGECSYQFEPEKWYTMTIEFIGDEVVAHLSDKHLVYAKHPIIHQERTYFALQVDQAGARFDNLQVFQVGRHRNYAENLITLEKIEGEFPVTKTVEVEYETRKRNAHARLHLEDPSYRKLVNTVKALDMEKVDRFPAVYSSQKAFRKKITSLRKKLHAEDPVYKDTLFATFRASRAMESYLLEKEPSINDQPTTGRKAALERARLKHENTPVYKKLADAAQSAQAKLEKEYPQLFISDEEIKAKRDAARKALKNDLEFKALSNKRAEAYKAQQEYLHHKDMRLAELLNRLKQNNSEK